jgi:hypothetical protein
MARERIAKHGLVGHSLRSRIEARRQLLKRLFPPPWNEPPAHWDKLGGAISRRLYDIDRVRRRDVVARLQTAATAAPPSFT